MASITGDGRAAIERTLEVVTEGQRPLRDWKTVFEVERVIQWIKAHGFKKVCLQFPDEYVSYSPRILDELESGTGARCYILADSTYGSCCVDEKTAAHVPGAEAIVHFGQSCLSPSSSSLPLLYIFTRPEVDTEPLERSFRQCFLSEDKVYIAYDVIYQVVAEQLFSKLTESYPSLVLTTLIVPGQPSILTDAQGTVHHGRFFPGTPNSFQDAQIFFIGSRSLPNLLLVLPSAIFRVIDPSAGSDDISSVTSNINKLIRKRNYYIEKLKDASSVGILVGTLVVANYLQLIERLKDILKAVGKTCHVVSIGEINPAKLANFSEIEAFIFVGCPELVNYYISDEVKGQFYQPIVTPWDVESAFCDGGGDYVIDWAFLVDKGPPKVKEIVEGDISLVTGGFRGQRSWVGLNLEEESPSSDAREVHIGRSGIAASYNEEPINKLALIKLN